MAISPQRRAQFVNAYTRALVKAWSSEEFSRRLDQDPKATLNEVGLGIAADAQVELIRTVPDASPHAGLYTQVELWETGLATGRYELHVPYIPRIQTAELSEGDLEAVAADSFIGYAGCLSRGFTGFT